MLGVDAWNCWCLTELIADTRVGIRLNLNSGLLFFIIHISTNIRHCLTAPCLAVVERVRGSIAIQERALVIVGTLFCNIRKSYRFHISLQTFCCTWILNKHLTNTLFIIFFCSNNCCGNDFVHHFFSLACSINCFNFFSQGPQITMKYKRFEVHLKKTHSFI